MNKTFTLMLLLSLLTSESLAKTQKASDFVAEMRSNSQFGGEIQNSQFTQTCGKFEFPGSDGKNIEVIFGGSTHDSSPVIVGDQFFTTVTESEKKFLESCFFKEEKNCDLLVEQGDALATGNFSVGIKNLEIPSTLKDELKIDSIFESKDRHHSEMDVISREFRRRGKSVTNFDLQGSVGALEYIYNKFGLNRMLQHLELGLRQFFSPQNPQTNFPSNLSSIGEKLIRESSISDKVPPGIFTNFVKDPRRKFAARTNAIREDYMMHILKRQKGPICILAHSTHISNLVNLIVDDITSFELKSFELKSTGISTEAAPFVERQEKARKKDAI